MERQLNEFQIECENKLQEALKTKGVSLSNRKVTGERETFVEARIKDLKIWIYLDGTDIISDDRKVIFRFEELDFRSPTDLIKAFVSEIMGHLSKQV